MQILKLQEFSEQTIREIISSSLEESINIEFKSGPSLSQAPATKKEIAKDISAFANSDGGLIFYGINEEDHVATSLSFIDGRVYTKEWLENVIIANIQPRIEGLDIFPIRFEGDLEKTIYVVKIPQSLSLPHISSDKKYYRRFNFQSVPMEEYEIRSLYFRQRESDISVYAVAVKCMDREERENKNHVFYIEIQIANDGKFISNNYKVACNISNCFDIIINYDKSNNYSITNRVEEGIKISNNEAIPLFPDEVLTVLGFKLSIPRTIFDNIISEMNFTILTFNTTKFESEKFDISEMLFKTKEDVHNEDDINNLI